MSKFIPRLMGMKKYILQLLNKHSRDTFMKDILISVADDDIKFDQNPYLFAFNNKIYDLKLGQFIDPKPELYVSLTTGYNWNDKDENHQKLIHDIIDTIFPQTELK
jgi:phage/plasmid-associated DNA primase